MINGSSTCSRVTPIDAWPWSRVSVRDRALSLDPLSSVGCTVYLGYTLNGSGVKLDFRLAKSFEGSSSSLAKATSNKLDKAQAIG